jgi:hypothetical protein
LSLRLDGAKIIRKWTITRFPQAQIPYNPEDLVCQTLFLKIRQITGEGAPSIGKELLETTRFVFGEPFWTIYRI